MVHVIAQWHCNTYTVRYEFSASRTVQSTRPCRTWPQNRPLFLPGTLCSPHLALVWWRCEHLAHSTTSNFGIRLLCLPKSNGILDVAMVCPYDNWRSHGRTLVGCLLDEVLLVHVISCRGLGLLKALIEIRDLWHKLKVHPDADLLEALSQGTSSFHIFISLFDY